MSMQGEILIIGGGVIGVSTAYYLTKQNLDVAILEKNTICSGASYGNAGLVTCQNLIPTAAPGVVKQAAHWLFAADSPFYIKPRLDFDLLHWLLQFSAACRRKPMLRTISVLNEMKQIGSELFDELTSNQSLACGYQKNGRLFLYRDKTNFEKGIETTKFLRQYGINARVLDQNAVREKEPNLTSSVIGGIYYAGYAHLIPDRFVHGLAGLVAELGGSIKTGTEVIGFETSGRRISTVITTRGEFHPEQVVLTAGACSPVVGRELGLKIPIQPGKGYSITVKRPETSSRFPMALADDKIAVTPMGDKLRFSSTLELVGYDLSINRRRIAATRRAVNQYLTGMSKLELIELWSGLRPNTPDTLPLIGRSRSFDNLILATGHDVLGMTHSLITGTLVSQIIANEKPIIDLSPFRPERFG